MSGWISLHRQIEKNWVWKEKPFSKGQAWIDLLLLANHEPARLKTRTGFVDICRGEHHTEERTLQERWGWSRSKVRNFIRSLVAEKMITFCVKKSTTGKTTEGTTITILNYSVYQDCKKTKEPTKKTEKNQRETNGEPTRDLNNNGNNPLTTFEEEWNNYKAMRVTIRKPVNENIEKLVKAKLSKLATTEEEQVEILRQSTINSWTDVYALKQNYQSRTSQLSFIEKCKLASEEI